MQDVDEPDWEAIRRAYEVGTSSVADICLLFGVGRSALYGRAKRERWTARRATKGMKKKVCAEISSSTFKASEGEADLATILRDAQTLIQRQLAAGDGDSVADLERQVRMVKSLVSTAKMVEQMEKQPSETGKGQERKKPLNSDNNGLGVKNDDEADALRRELARRIEALGKNEGD